jgi:hypothetical protein
MSPQKEKIMKKKKKKYKDKGYIEFCKKVYESKFPYILFLILKETEKAI